ncbi:DUF6630 family protein [Laceyella putida]|uniref:DUF6630 domain-containing protein n=1 Tax=Laceyella putida TaxID=110101 RepID=A0ABW2RPG9_9BACL
MKYQTESLLTLCHQLLPEDPTLIAEVEWSIHSPISYLYHHPMQTLWGRRLKLHKPLSNLPWFALLHGLKQRKLIFHFHQPQAQKRMAWVIKEGRFNGSYAYQHEQWDSEKDLFIQLASHYLQSFDYVLCEFSPSPDGITMGIIPEEVAEDCIALAHDSGYGTITLHSAIDSPPVHMVAGFSHIPSLPLYQHFASLWKA